MPVIAASTIIFAIEAGVKLGQKVHEVLIDETRERALLLPLGDVVGDEERTNALDFLSDPVYAKLFEPNGPYHNMDSPAKVARTLLGLEYRGVKREELVDALGKMHRYKQVSDQFAARPVVQRILGTVVEIGISYYSTHPPALFRDSAANKVVEGFVEGLNQLLVENRLSFAEDSFASIAEKVLGYALTTALNTLSETPGLVVGDERIKALVSSSTRAMSAEIAAIREQAAAGFELSHLATSEAYLKRLAGSILRGGATAIAENPGLFVGVIRNESDPKNILHAVIIDIAEGVRDNRDLFTAVALERLAAVAIGAVGKNPAILSKDKFLRILIQDTSTALAKAVREDDSRLFSESSAVLILEQSLATVANHAEMLIDPNNPRRQFAAETVAALAAGINKGLEDNRSLDVIFTEQTALRLAKIALDKVAANPERLLGLKASASPADTVLAQIIGSVASALTMTASGDLIDIRRIASTETLVGIVDTALLVTLRNIDKLLDLKNPDQKTNLLHKVLQSLATAIDSQADILANANPPGSVRDLVDREVFLEIVQKVLPVVSSHVTAATADDGKLVGVAVDIAFDLARGALAGDINGETLPDVIEAILRTAARNEAAPDAVRTAITAFEAAIADRAGGGQAGEASRRFLDLEAFLDALRQIMPLIASHADQVTEDEGALLRSAVDAAFALADGALAGRITADNFPAVIGNVLTEAVIGNFPPDSTDTQTIAAAEAIILAA